MSIDDTWRYLYSSNPKIQAFAVSEGTNIIWQTDNWNLVKDIESVFDILTNGGPTMRISKVEYDTVHSSEDTFYATSNGKGHFMMAQVEKQTNTWLLAWASADSVPELAIIDLRYAAKKLVK